MRYKLFQAVSVGVLLVLIASAPNFAAESDATAKITRKSIAAGVGYSWGSGVLTYKAGTIGSALAVFPPVTLAWRLWNSRGPFQI